MWEGGRKCRIKGETKRTIVREMEARFWNAMDKRDKPDGKNPPPPPLGFYATFIPIHFDSDALDLCCSTQLYESVTDEKWKGGLEMARWDWRQRTHPSLQTLLFLHRALHGEGLLLLLIAYVLWISLVAERGLCNTCILHSSASYRLLCFGVKS